MDLTKMQITVNGNWQLYTNTLPLKAVPLGTVTFNGETGALAYIAKTMTYVQVNAGVIRRLDGRMVAGILGISGRPQTVEDGKRINVYLDKVSIEKAKEIGDGNVSSGIRIALSK